LAWLLLAAGTAPTDPDYFNQLAIKIPLTIKQEQRQYIRELNLYVSTDEGRTWHQQAVNSPEQDSFKFFAPKDGSYWFIIDVVNQQGLHNPADLKTAVPSRKIVIDTLPPMPRIVSALRKGEEIEVAWEIQEDHPDLSSLRLEYRMPDAPDMWYTAPVKSVLNGKTSFPVKGSSEVSVRLQIRDLAQNLGTAEAKVPGLSGVTPVSHISTDTDSGSRISPLGQSSTGQKPLDPGHTIEAEKKVNPPKEFHETGVSKNLLATSAKSRPRVVNAPPPAKKLPPVRVVNSRKVALEYSVGKVGPSGLGKVELWLTRDDGAHWQRYAEDPDMKLPTPSGGKCQRTVELPGEGTFGLRLVVFSRAGLGKGPPKPGDLPQMRIEVDLTPPVAELKGIGPAPDRRDALLITWAAHDPNHADLPATPVTLQWAEQKGSWQTIATGLPNNGRHIWQLPANMPVRVYFRLMVRDAAGNKAVAETEEPQLVDLSEPEGTILGVVEPVGQ
jgi:hypothetical protein